MMIRRGTILSLLSVLSLGLVVQMGCAGPGGGTTNDNGNGNTAANTNDNTGGGGPAVLTAVKTDIDVHNSGRIAVGDDLLVYGYGGSRGVDYIIPSAGDTAGRDLPDGDTFSAGSFAVAGNKVALVSSSLITIFDSETATSQTIGEDQIRLVNTPIGIHSQGHLTADGSFIACRNDPGSNGGTRIIVIDVSADVPTLLSFTNDPEDLVSHIVVDAEAREVVAAAGDSFYVYSLDDPDAAPTIFDTTDNGGIGSDHVFTFDGGYIFYEDDEAFGNAWFLNTADGTSAQLTENPSSGDQCHGGGSFVYFVGRDAGDSNGNDSRSGLGDVPGPGATLAGDQEIDGNTGNNGFVGWSQTCSITPDGELVFVSGRGSIGSGEFLQVSTGGGFSLLTDPDGSSPHGLPATDVVTSSTLVGFKTGDGTTAGSSTKVGYIRLTDE